MLYARVIRFVVYPRKVKFVKKTLNIIDMMTILPFYMELLLPHLGIESHFKEFTGKLGSKKRAQPPGGKRGGTISDEGIGRRSQTWMGKLLINTHFAAF